MLKTGSTINNLKRLSENESLFLAYNNNDINTVCLKENLGKAIAFKGWKVFATFTSSPNKAFHAQKHSHLRRSYPFLKWNIGNTQKNGALLQCH